MGIRYIVVRVDTDRSPSMITKLRRWIHATAEAEGSKAVADLVLTGIPNYYTTATVEDYRVVDEMFTRVLEEAKERVRDGVRPPLPEGVHYRDRRH